MEETRNKIDTDSFFGSSEPDGEELLSDNYRRLVPHDYKETCKDKIIEYQQRMREKDTQIIETLRKRLLEEMGANAASIREEAEKISNKVTPPETSRQQLPNKRTGYTQKFKLNGQTLYLRTGNYPDGSLGEIYCDIAKQGSFIRSMLSAFCIAISVGLQHGVPLEDFARHFLATKFEPGGMVQGHDRISMASSILDLIFKDLSIEYLGKEELANKPKVADHPVEEIKGLKIDGEEIEWIPFEEKEG